MVLVVSRFRVANGLASEVRAAFEGRPRSVERTPGFLGMEVYTDAGDPAIFWLVTRWTDAETYRVWHRSPDHRASHAFIPKGLKLDPAETMVRVLDRVPGVTTGGVATEHLLDHAPLIARHIGRAAGVFWLRADARGHVVACNEAMARALGTITRPDVPVSVWDRLPPPSAERLRACTMVPSDATVRIQLVEPDGHPLTLDCEIDCLPGGFVLVGSPPWDEHRVLELQLTELNNALAVMARENAAQTRVLRRANEALDAARREVEESHWHIRKFAEYLPICVSCQRVKNDDASWETLATFLARETPFLTHGYCPACADRALAAIARDHA
jgi:heme-degrading monooxygenase HmoA